MSKMKLRKRVRWMTQDLMDKIMRRPPRPKPSAITVIGYLDNKQIHTFPFKMSEQEVIKNDK
jgi:flagellar motor protein MotB